MRGATLERVAWGDERAVALRRQLDVEMAERYGTGAGREPADLTAKRARALAVRHSDVVLTLLAVADDGTPAGHIALRRLGEEWEVKRLAVLADYRRRGIAAALLDAVEDEARRGGAPRLILQAGEQQPEALALYESRGWTPIPVYEPYVETMPRSRCFEKVLPA
ncbi:MAG TPA: GNAT family N-acetyltransferase [Naasia sp.]